MQGQCVMSEEVRSIVFSSPDRSLRPPRLTAREQEVLYWIGEGLTTSAIAAKLFITAQTVESHRYTLLQKLGVKNTAGLVKIAIMMGMAD